MFQKLSIKNKEGAVLAVKTSAVGFIIASILVWIISLIVVPALIYAQQPLAGYVTLLAITVASALAGWHLYAKQSRLAGMATITLSIAMIAADFIFGTSPYLSFLCLLMAIQGARGAFWLHHAHIAPAEIKSLYKKEQVDLGVGKNHTLFGHPLSQVGWMICLAVITILVFSVAFGLFFFFLFAINPV